MREAQIVIETWRRQYDTIRPHALIGYKPPAPEVLVPAFAAWAGCATPTGSAGHAGATANLKLSFHLDRSAGADHWLDEIAAGTVTDVEQIAAREKCSLRKVNMTSRSPFSYNPKS